MYSIHCLPSLNRPHLPLLCYSPSFRSLFVRSSTISFLQDFLAFPLFLHPIGFHSVTFSMHLLALTAQMSTMFFLVCALLGIFSSVRFISFHRSTFYRALSLHSIFKFIPFRWVRLFIMF